MILTRLMGGLGNQMFQYAAGKSASLRAGVPLLLDGSLIRPSDEAHKHEPVRNYDLDIHGLPERFATPLEVALFNGHTSSRALKLVHRLARLTGRYPLVVQDRNRFLESLPTHRDATMCLVGRWQSESYFGDHADAIRDAFRFRNLDPLPYVKHIATQIAGDEAVLIQIRRQDYVTHPVYRRTLGALTSRYYFDGLDVVRSRLRVPNLKVYVGGDDMDWCVHTFGTLPNVVFLDQENSKRGYCSHLWLLSQFRHHIISNSTFAWWGAWLGEKSNSIVIAPERWTRDPGNEPQRLIPYRWRRVTNDFEPID